MSERDSGSILDGKYEIVERLATGGMGEVYRARHIHLHEHRVIKILRGDKAADAHFNAARLCERLGDKAAAIGHLKTVKQLSGR